MGKLVRVPERTGMLATISCGFETDSKYKTLVDDLIAAPTTLGFEMSTKVVVILDVLGRKWARRACVPPYRRLEATM